MIARLSGGLHCPLSHHELWFRHWIRFLAPAARHNRCVKWLHVCTVSVNFPGGNNIMKHGSPQCYDIVLTGKQFSQFRRIVVSTFRDSEINVDIFRNVGDSLPIDVYNPRPQKSIKIKYLCQKKLWIQFGIMFDLLCWLIVNGRATEFSNNSASWPPSPSSSAL